MKRTDEAMYQIYALGEKAISKSNIYSNWTFIAHRLTTSLETFRQMVSLIEGNDKLASEVKKITFKL